MYKPGDIRRRSQRRYKRRLIAAALIIGIMAVSYFLVFRTGLFSLHEGVPDSIMAVETVKDTSSHSRMLQEEPGQDETLASSDTPTFTADLDVEDKAVVPGKESIKEDEKEPVAKNTVAPSAPDQTPEKSPGSVYKIISVAHFYNAPDEKTRRKAYVNHWNNSYASIKPEYEKNGFIYVVFTNHQGQTSKGWLRKKDLQEVNSFAAGNNKE